MINHMVIIGQQDVSFDVISVKINQSISVDSDPAKLEVVLANRHQKYTMPTEMWPLQVTKLRIYLTGLSTLGTSSDNPDIVGEDSFQLAAVGHITAVSANAEEATVTGECDVGHLADALHKDYNFKRGSSEMTGEDDGSCIEILKYILQQHKPPIELRMDASEAANMDVIVALKTYDSYTDFYTVIEDIRDEVGAVFWSNEEYIIDFHDPKSYFGTYNLDKYLVNPDATASIMGFCNVVNLCGNPALDESDIGTETSDEPPIVMQVMDRDSYDEVGALVAPLYIMYNQPNPKEAKKRAVRILKFFKLHENALTKPVVCTILPPIQSKVVYKPFIPIDEDGVGVGQIKGIVIERVINYSAEGLETELTISPGLIPESTDPVEDGDTDAIYYPPSSDEVDDESTYLAYYYKDGELQGPGELIEGPRS